MNKFELYCTDDDLDVVYFVFKCGDVLIKFDHWDYEDNHNGCLKEEILDELKEQVLFDGNHGFSDIDYSSLLDLIQYYYSNGKLWIDSIELADWEARDIIAANAFRGHSSHIVKIPVTV